MSKRKKKKAPVIVTETMEQYLERGGNIQVFKPKYRCQRMLFASGNFTPKRSNKGDQKGLTIPGRKTRGPN